MFKLKNPQRWAGGKEYSGDPKWDVRFLIVANQSGLQHFVNQAELNTGFA